MLVLNDLNELLLPCVYVMFRGDEPLYIGASGFVNRWVPKLNEDNTPKISGGIIRVLKSDTRMPKREQARRLATRTEICFYRYPEESLRWERKLIHGVHPVYNIKCDGNEDRFGLNKCYWPSIDSGKKPSPFETGPRRTRQMLEALGWPANQPAVNLIDTTF